MEKTITQITTEAGIAEFVQYFKKDTGVDLQEKIGKVVAIVSVDNESDCMDALLVAETPGMMTEETVHYLTFRPTVPGTFTLDGKVL